MGLFTERFFLIAAALGMIGAWFSLRWSIAWLRLLARKYRRGVPYLWGSAGRAFALLVPSLLIGLAGVVLGTAGYGLSGYQPIGDMTRVGTLQVGEAGGGGLEFRLVPDPESPLAPAGPVVTPVTGRWAVAGQFIRWSRAMHWLGLRDSHRVAWFLAVDDPSEIPVSDRIVRRSLLRSGPGRLWPLLERYDRYLPMVELREFQSPWQSGSAEGLELYGYAGGYILIHPGGEG